MPVVRAMVLPVVVEAVVVVAPTMMTPPPPVVVVLAALLARVLPVLGLMVPVQKEPRGQQAILPTLSALQTAVVAQQTFAKATARVEQEL